ncbi:unnamed protein product [Cuscuta epithymum]|uniref:Cation/H+ exchanger transmembrane domain-containing protein n=1 Tax=Cuscuta epithymum TaxID=186058 RepID=A0AAV0F187_9ASTE|nr:unnamed protein product [Cuscuta epithymum]
MEKQFQLYLEDEEFTLGHPKRKVGYSIWDKENKLILSLHISVFLIDLFSFCCKGGVIIGPSVLSRSKKFRDKLFPERAKFITRNVGLLGFMYFLFLSGVKTDLSLLKKVGKKYWYAAGFIVVLPLLCVIFVAIPLRKSMEKEVAKVSSLIGIASEFAITSFPVIYPIIKEFNLLSSEMGRTALSVAVVSDVIGNQFLLIFDASKQGEAKSSAAYWFTLSTIVMMVSVFIGLRQAMIWIVRITPEGKPVDQIYVIAILLGVMVIGFVCDFTGIPIANGPLWLGLAVPEGPPLGETIVEKSETFILDLLMPFSYVYVGLITDVSTISSHWSILQPLFIIAVVGYITKLLSVLLISSFLNMPLRDGLALSLILSLRGQTEVLLYLHWIEVKVTILACFFTILTPPKKKVMLDHCTTLQLCTYKIYLLVQPNYHMQLTYAMISHANYNMFSHTIFGHICVV